MFLVHKKLKSHVEVQTSPDNAQCADHESNKVESKSKLTAQSEQVCLKNSKYILFEILENQT